MVVYLHNNIELRNQESGIDTMSAYNTIILSHVKICNHTTIKVQNCFIIPKVYLILPLYNHTIFFPLTIHNP